MKFYYPNKPIRIYDHTKILGMISNAPEAWICQPKWNGKRVEIECNDNQVKLYSREGVYWAKEQWNWLAVLPLEQPWFLDGELLPGHKIHVWDFAVMSGTPCYAGPYGTRLDYLKKRLATGTVIQGQQSFALIETLPATDYAAFLARQNDERVEGIVWKNLASTKLWGPHKTSEIAGQVKYRF